MSSLFVIVPGFGNPHAEHKFHILRNNLAKIRQYQWRRLVLRICVYDLSLTIPEDLARDPQIEWVFEKGIVGQFIKKYAKPDDVAAFSHVLMILDDVELKDDVSFATILRWEDFFRFDIMSPSMTCDSKYQFDYMLTSTQLSYDIAVTVACEAFCYFMRVDAYSQRYYPHVDGVDNPWMWGLDMCLWMKFGIKIGIMNKMTMKHHYKNECYSLRPDQNPTDGYIKTLAKYGLDTDMLASQMAKLYVISDLTS